MLRGSLVCVPAQEGALADTGASHTKAGVEGYARITGCWWGPQSRDGRRSGKPGEGHTWLHGLPLRLFCKSTVLPNQRICKKLRMQAGRAHTGGGKGKQSRTESVSALGGPEPPQSDGLTSRIRDEGQEGEAAEHQ